jgi:hypothetical protein
MDGRVVPQEIFVLTYGNQPPLRTMGYDLFNDKKCNFSTFFKLTVFACLAYDPTNRPTSRRVVERCQRAIAILSHDPSSPLRSNYMVHSDTHRRLKPDPAPRGRFVRPIYIGESPLGPGADIDEIHLGPGLDDTTKLLSKLKFAPLPPSPPPGWAFEHISGRFQVPDKSTEEKTLAPTDQMKEGGQVASNQILLGLKRQRENDDDLPSTEKGLNDFSLVGRYPISGITGAKSAPGERELMDNDMSSDESSQGSIASAESIYFSSGTPGE